MSDTETREITYRLIGSGMEPSMVHAAKALMFGHLVDLAFETVKQFRSDLYHDALTINTMPLEYTGGTENQMLSFFWGCRAFGGTTIGWDREMVEKHNDRAFAVTLYSENGTWYCTIETLK